MRLATANREINSLSSRLSSLPLPLSYNSSFFLLPSYLSFDATKKSLFLFPSLVSLVSHRIRPDCERETDLSAIKNRRGFAFKLERLTRRSCGHSSPCSRNKKEADERGSSPFSLSRSLMRKRVLYIYFLTIIARCVLVESSYVNFDFEITVNRSFDDYNVT